MTRLGQAIRNYRDKGGLSLRQFQMLTGFNAQYASEIEKGIKMPIATVGLVQLARAIDRPAMEVITAAFLDRMDRAFSEIPNKEARKK